MAPDDKTIEPRLLPQQFRVSQHAPQIIWGLHTQQGTLTHVIRDSDDKCGSVCDAVFASPRRLTHGKRRAGKVSCCYRV